MKKTVLMLSLALPFMLASCGDDNEPVNVSLDQTSVAIDYNGTATVKANEKDCAWESSNPFVATVDNKGNITAHHVGEAVISATKDNSTAKCNVVVNATNNNFTAPLQKWGESASWVKSNIPASLNLTLYTEDANSLVYTTAGDFPIYIYAFTDKKLAGATLSVSEEMDEKQDLQGFLEQRYALVKETDDAFTYADANNLTDANVAIEYTFDADSESVIATWVPVSHTRGISEYDTQIHAKHIGIVREIKK